MASCKFDGGKCHGASAVKAALRHNDTSPQMRAEAAKGNPDIDVSRAGLNVRLWGGSYAERSEAYDRRIAQLDSQPGANIRKDRVTGQLIEVPVPPGLPRSSYNDWMRRVVEIQVNRFGQENVIAADGHWDEEHEYIGEDGKPTMSRVHVQLVVVPVVNGRLCGKEFYSRKVMRELNDEVQAMSETEFGVDFMDGSKKKGKKSQAQLKAESVQRAEEAAQRAAAGILSEARARAVQIEQNAVEGAQRAAEGILSEARAKEKKAEEDALAASEAFQDAKRARRAARVSERTADWNKAEAQKLLETARITAKERQMLDAAKRLKLKGGQTMYDYLEHQVRVDSINAPQTTAQQPQRGRDLPDF